MIDLTRINAVILNLALLFSSIAALFHQAHRPRVIASLVPSAIERAHLRRALNEHLPDTNNSQAIGYT